MVTIVERGKGFRPNIPPLEGVKPYTQADLERDVAARREGEKRSREFWESFRPESPDGSGPSEPVDYRTHLAFSTGGRHLYKAPSGIYFYYNPGNGNTKIVSEDHTARSLALLEEWDRRKQE